MDEEVGKVSIVAQGKCCRFGFGGSRAEIDLATRFGEGKREYVRYVGFAAGALVECAGTVGAYEGAGNSVVWTQYGVSDAL